MRWRFWKKASAAALQVHDEDPPSLAEAESLPPAESAYRKAVIAVWSDDPEPVLPPESRMEDPESAPEVSGLVHLHPGAQADPRSVFLVSPDLDLQDQLRSDLEGQDFHVRVFSRVFPMMDQWMERPPATVLLDAKLQDRDVLRLCRAIRRQPLLSRVAIVILSHKTDPQSRKAFFEAGADEWVSLPYLTEEVVNRIENQVERRRQRASAETARPPSAGPRPAQVIPFSSGAIRVLVADYDPVFRDLLCHHLTRIGWKVTVAQDGDEARSLLRSHTFHLAVLEAMLPFRDGFELLDEVRGASRSRPLKVVLLSAQAPDVLQVRAFSQGADDFIAKPFNPEVAVSRLQRLVQM